jgi:hypothetical protein
MLRGAPTTTLQVPVLGRRDAVRTEGVPLAARRPG